MKITNTIIVGILVLGSAAWAQPASLGSGEVSLQLAATGKVESPPDTFTILVPVGTSAASAASARDANKTKVGRVQTALAQRGIAGGKVTLLPGQAQFGFVGNAAPDEDGMPPAALAAMGRKSASSMIQIVVTTRAELDKVTDALDAEDVTLIGSPVAALRDDSGARTAAVALAIAQAKRDAEAYASPLGLKVARVARVANYGDQRVSDWQNSTAWMQQLLTGGSANRQVTTTANVWVDFVLTPR